MILELLTWAGYIFITLLVGVVASGVIYTRWHYGVLETTEGLPALIKPYFVGGSDPFFYKGICCEEDIKRVKMYGPIFGVSYLCICRKLFIISKVVTRLLLHAYYLQMYEGR